MRGEESEGDEEGDLPFDESFDADRNGSELPAEFSAYK